MRTLIMALALVVLVSSCGGSDSVTGPGGQTTEDWSYPPDSVKVALTLLAPDSSRVGDPFDVKLIIYNVPQAFGVAVNVEYDRGQVAIERVLTGPALEVGGHALGIGFDDTTRGRVEVGSTMRNGQSPRARTSGVLCKLRCRAKASGTLRLRVAPDFTLTTSTGESVPDRSNVRREDATIVVR